MTTKTCKHVKRTVRYNAVLFGDPLSITPFMQSVINSDSTMQEVIKALRLRIEVAYLWSSHL